MGIFGVFTSLYFVGSKLIETSTVVEGFRHSSASMAAPSLAFAAVAVYVPVNTWIAVKLGGSLQRLNITHAAGGGSYRGELTCSCAAASRSPPRAARACSARCIANFISDIDKTWGKLNIVHSGYMSFELIYNFLAARMSLMALA